MRKTFLTILSFFVLTGANATENVLFGTGHENSFSLYAGVGTGSGSLLKLVNPFDWEISPMMFLMAQYAQPMTIMRLPARASVNIMQNTAGHSAHGLSFFGAGISWDIALLNHSGWYLGVGIGPYYRDNRDRWVSSRLFFGEKFFIGKNIDANWRLEFFTQHFSNGDMTPINHGFNFSGIALNYSF